MKLALMVVTQVQVVSQELVVVVVRSVQVVVKRGRVVVTWE